MNNFKKTAESESIVNVEQTTESNVEQTAESNVNIEQTAESNIEQTTESNVNINIEQTAESNVEQTTESNVYINLEQTADDLEKEFNNLIAPKVKRVDKENKDKKFASASLTFSHNKRGYLLCNEFRWREKKNLYHLVGGKIENTDVDILYTSVREFVEETNMFMDNSLVINKDIKYISNKIYNLIKLKVKYFDICVNKDKKLFHRFYLFDINKFQSKNIRTKIIQLPNFMNKLEEKDNKELNSLLWVNEDNKESIIKEQSFLLNMFYNNIKNFI